MNWRIRKVLYNFFISMVVSSKKFKMVLIRSRVFLVDVVFVFVVLIVKRNVEGILYSVFFNWV